jgi:fructose-bisphosphate aldolase class II
VLINLKDLLADAKRKEYGVMATVAFNFDSAEAVIEAAEEKTSPVILMASEALFKYFNFEKLIEPMIEMAKEATVPVTISLDHGKNENLIMRCIETGFPSVMFDGSTLPLDENIRTVKEITKKAHPLGISVEGEVGVVAGLEGDVAPKDMDPGIDHLTRPEDAVRFVKETDVDALAISVGTVHGLFAGKFDIDFERLLKIRDAIETPLVLHGCSGLSDRDFKKIIKCGVTKINYYANLLLEATDKAKEIANSGEDFNYMDLNYRVMQVFKNAVKIKMDVFGSSGKG